MNEWTFFPYFFLWRFDPIPCHGLRLQCFAITLRHNTLGRSPLNEWSARRRDLYLTTNNTHKRQTSIPTSGFEPTIAGSEPLQIHALGREVTLFPNSEEKLVTSRGPASFPYRLWTMLLDSNGQRQGLLKRVWTYWDAGSVGEENLEFSISKEFPLRFLKIACLVLWNKRRIFLVTLYRFSYPDEIFDWYSAVI